MRVRDREGQKKTLIKKAVVHAQISLMRKPDDIFPAWLLHTHKLYIQKLLADQYEIEYFDWLRKTCLQCRLSMQEKKDDRIIH